MKTTKKWIQSVSIALILTLALQAVPFTALAQSTAAPADSPENGGVPAAPIVQEITEERGEYRKTYQRADGSKTQIQSAQPIHYQKNGAWAEIDNRLELEKDRNGQEFYQNKESDLTVSLPKILDENQTVSIQKGSYSISFSPEKTMLQGRTKGIVTKREDPAQGVSEAQKKAGLDRLSSKIQYKNIRRHTDLEYVVTPGGIKENVILQKMPDGAPAYSFQFHASNLKAELQKDRSIRFLDHQGQAVFFIPAPLMYDAQYRVSRAIETQLAENGDGSFTLTYTPSAQWLGDGSRCYPVTIDPVIRRADMADAIQDTWIGGHDSAGTNGSTDPFCFVSTYKAGDRDESSTLYQLDDPTLLMLATDKSIVTNATLSLSMTTLSGACNVAARRVTASWAPGDVTFNTRPAYDSKIIDYVSAVYADVMEKSWRSLDLTQQFNDWISGKYPNYGIQLDAMDSNAVFISSNDGVAETAPILEFTYYSSSGVRSGGAYHTLSAGDAGTVYYNDVTGKIAILRDDLSLPGNCMPVSIRRVYSPSLLSFGKTYGQQWKTNYDQSLLFQTDHFNYIDENGTTRYFTKAEQLAEDGRELWTEEEVTGSGISPSSTTILLDKGAKTTNYDKITVLESDGTKLRFNTSGQLVTITDAAKKAHQIKINYLTAAKIDAIVDGVGRQYKFHYTTLGSLVKADVLTAIECLDANGAPITFTTQDNRQVPLKVEYEYKVALLGATSLKKVIYPDGSTQEYTFGDTTTLQDSEKNQVEIIKTNNVITKIQKKVWDREKSAYLPAQSLDIDVQSWNHKEFTDETGATQIMQFDAAGRVISSRTKGGPAQFSQYGADGEAAVSPDMSGEGRKREPKYNYIKNGDFARAGASSGSAQEWSFAAASGRRAAISADDTRDTGLDQNVYQLTSAVSKTASTTQTVALSGKKGDCFTIAGWGRSGTAVPVTVYDNRVFGIRVEAPNASGVYEEILRVGFEPSVSTWQYNGGNFELQRDTPQIRVTLAYDRQIGSAQFDGIQLYKEDWKSAGFDDLVREETCPCEDCPETDCPCACASEAACTCPQCKRGAKNVTDDHGNVTQSTWTDGQKSIQYQNTYSANGNYLLSASGNPLGRAAAYTYHEGSGLLTSQDGVRYGYDAGQNVTALSKEVKNLADGASQIQNRFYYNNRRLERITHNGFDYHLKQNAFGNLSSLKIGTQNYVSNTYSNDSRQLLTAEAFGNGQTIRYEYDSQHRLSRISQDNGAAWRFALAYDGLGLASVTDSLRGTKTLFTEDGMKTIRLSDDTLVFALAAQEEKQIHTLLNQTYTLESASSRDIAAGADRRTRTLTFGGQTLSSALTTDYFGRVTKKETGLKNGITHQASLTYRNPSNTETTTFVETYRDFFTKGDQTPLLLDEYQYAYTDGRITAMRKNNTLEGLYVYDEAGQLTGEIRSGAGATAYTYDAGGNLRTKSAGGQTIAYEYGDANWKDKLTAYGGKPIIYDAIGNPLSYDGTTFTWGAGRQLKKAVQAEQTIEYEYNEQGLRTLKQVTRNSDPQNPTTWEYVWNGTRLLGEIITKNGVETTVYFCYDEEDAPTGFLVNGTDACFYQQDGLGNIRGIVNADGEKLLGLDYDAWGFTTATGNTELLDYSPFAYRGYLYDRETSLYYLQTRYYNPEWGRFLNADTIPAKEELLGLNLFAYCLNDPVNKIDVQGESPSDMDPLAKALAAILFIGALYFENPLLAEFMDKAIEVNPNQEGIVTIQLEGYESYLDRLFHYKRRFPPPPPLLVYSNIFTLMALWVQLKYFAKYGTLLPLDIDVITREIAVHVFGFITFQKRSGKYDPNNKLDSIYLKCAKIDINIYTKRWLEDYVFGYKWPKWLEDLL